MGAGALVVAAWFIVLSVYDLRHRRLPNWLTLPGGAAVLVVAALMGRGGAAAVGAAALFVFYLLVHLVAPKGMGAGDVKLAIGIGGLTGAVGANAWMLAAVGAPLLTALWGLARRSEAGVPHGPSMCLAAAVAVAPVLW